MEPVLLVSDDEAKTARTIEEKLLALPRASGILFAGVSVVPGGYDILKPGAERLPATYHIWVGCSRTFNEATMDPLIRVTLRDEIAAGTRISTEAHRGQIRGQLKSI